MDGMMKKRLTTNMTLRVVLFCVLALVAAVVPGCAEFGGDGSGMRNGYYSAVSADFDELGWKEFITLYVYNNRIVTVEYNARNASGLVLSWDGLAMRTLKAQTYTHPTQLLRRYSEALRNRQAPENVRRVAGDTYFYDSFKQLAAAAIARAKAGDKTVAEVRLSGSASGGR